MTRISVFALMSLSLVALAIPEGASAGAARDHAPRRHVSLHTAAPVPEIGPVILRSDLDLGTQVAIRIQDGHHGEGMN